MAQGPSHAFLSALARTAPPSASLALCVLACWQARAAVSPLDVVRAAASGRLPYYSLAHDSQALMAPHRSLFTWRFMAPSGMGAWRGKGREGRI